jgi:hypothetical protein
MDIGTGWKLPEIYPKYTLGASLHRVSGETFQRRGEEVRRMEGSAPVLHQRLGTAT